MKKIILVLLSISVFLPSNAEKCKIYGNAGTYAGETLRLYTYSDYITLTKKVVAEAKVDDEGYFSFLIETNETFEAFLDLYVFKGYIIAEPGKEFKIVLPKKTVRRREDIMNPYFKPYEFYIRILNDNNSVTSAMKKFDELYENSLKIIFKNPKHINPGLTEKKIKEIDDSTSYCKNKFFENYKKYKFLELRYNAVYKNKKAIVRKNFNNNPVLYKNPAYNKLLKEKLGTVLFETHGDTLYKLLGLNAGWNMLYKTAANFDMVSDPEFREYYLFVSLYREFFKNNIYKDNIISTLHYARKYIKNKNTLIAVNNFLDNSTALIEGNKSLDFRLPDNDTYIHALSDYQGKFVYLGFYSVDSYTCKKDMLMLKTLADSKKDMLKIILVFKENNTGRIKKFLEKTNSENITVLHDDTGGKIFDEYNVLVYPSYFLINPKGRLALVSAPGPADGFEAAYFKILQEWRREQIRKNKRQSGF